MIISDDLFFKSKRLSYRHLNDSDASDEYVSWFKEKNVRRFIQGSEEFTKKASLRDYIRSHNSKEDSILLGVFKGLDHIGNIKYEPIDFKEKVAWLGILIGNESNRSKGFGGEIIESTSLLMKNKLNIKKLKLGVNINNVAAQKSYKKIGFKIVEKKVGSYILQLNLT